MVRFSPRRLSRRLATSLTFLLLLTIVGAMVSEFFIEIGKERGWYTQPSERLGAAMTAFSDFVTQAWFLVISAFLTGITAGLWSDVVLRRWEAARTLSAAPLEPMPAAELGQLDYIVEGLQSLHDITSIFNSATKDTNRIVRTMSRYNWFLVHLLPSAATIRPRSSTSSWCSSPTTAKPRRPWPQ